ncbi:MAG: tRNA-binding protein [Acidimicrobiia bacterium]
MPTIDDWLQLRMRTGTVVRAEPYASPTSPDRAPGELQSSAKITDRYTPASLVGRTVGAVTPEGVILLRPDADVAPGTEVT